MGQHEIQAEFLQAMGQTTRLKILEILAEGERCVCDIQVAVGEQQSNVSKHLAILRRSGILTARREGGRVIYRIRNGRIPEFRRRLSDVEPRNFLGSET